MSEKRNIRREWLEANRDRRSGPSFFGCEPSGDWNVIPLVVTSVGTIERLRRLFGNPLAEDDE